MVVQESYRPTDDAAGGICHISEQSGSTPWVQKKEPGKQTLPAVVEI
jgi:hypothetical protein